VEGRGLTSDVLWKRPRARGLTDRSTNPDKGSAVTEGASRAGEAAASGGGVGRPVKSVGEPDAGNLQVRFDEGEVETGHGEAREAPATERVGNRLATPKQPRHLPTLPSSLSYFYECL
jgi:hypothetical protein